MVVVVVVLVVVVVGNASAKARTCRPSLLPGGPQKPREPGLPRTRQKSTQQKVADRAGLQSPPGYRGNALEATHGDECHHRSARGGSRRSSALHRTRLRQTVTLGPPATPRALYYGGVAPARAEAPPPTAPGKPDRGECLPGRAEARKQPGGTRRVSLKPSLLPPSRSLTTSMGWLNPHQPFSGATIRMITEWTYPICTDTRYV